MKTHAQRGHDILIAVPDEAIAAVAQVVLHHHEAFDGGGYPLGLKGEDIPVIPVLARVIAIADSYDAMATDRPYHHAKDHQAIMSILFEKQSHKTTRSWSSSLSPCSKAAPTSQRAVPPPSAPADTPTTTPLALRPVRTESATQAR